MRRSDIPAGLMASRRSDIDLIPERHVLAKLTMAELAGRLLAAGVYRRRAAWPHLDADLLQHRLGLAREVLETEDPERAAELVKGAGVDLAPAAGLARAL